MRYMFEDLVVNVWIWRRSLREMMKTCRILVMFNLRDDGKAFSTIKFPWVIRTWDGVSFFNVLDHIRRPSSHEKRLVTAQLNATFFKDLSNQQLLMRRHTCSDSVVLSWWWWCSAASKVYHFHLNLQGKGSRYVVWEQGLKKSLGIHSFNFLPCLKDGVEKSTHFCHMKIFFRMKVFFSRYSIPRETIFFSLKKWGSFWNLKDWYSLNGRMVLKILPVT